jgi:23S rRNA (guanosine2251-2'-O)-methyltransferase
MTENPTGDIVGIHPVYEALASGRRRIERIYLARGTFPDKVRRILKLARDQGIPVRKENKDALDRLAGGVAHQGVVAIAGVAAYTSLDEVLGIPDPLLVVLDGVQDPHNLGAVIRTSEAAGATGLVVAERRTSPLTAAVSKASAGAVEHLPIARVGNLTATLERMKSDGIWSVGVDPGAKANWTEFDYRVPVAIVLGGEHGGIRRLVRETCDALVGLPMMGRIQSLNVSVAAGIVLYEAVRQRGRQTSVADDVSKSAEI